MSKKIMSNKRYIVALSIIIVTILALYFMPRKMTVFGYSMIPVFSDGYKVTVTPYATYKLLGKEINHNDIIVVRAPDVESASADEYLFQMSTSNRKTQTVIKRAVALPGDSVEIISGLLYVNDELVEHNDLDAQTHEKIICDGYYVLGDNPYVSVDSRTYGCIQESDIIYVVTYQEKYPVTLGLAESLLPEQEG